MGRLTLLLSTLLIATPALASGGEGAGIPWKGFLFTLANFAILVWLIAKPVKRALSEKIAEKYRTIRNTFDEANAGIAKAGDRLGQFKKLLDGLPGEIAAIEREAREEIEREKAAFATDLAEGRKRIEEYARDLAEQELRAARALLVQEGVAAIAARAEQLLSGKIDPAKDRAIVADAALHLGVKG